MELVTPFMSGQYWEAAEVGQCTPDIEFNLPFVYEDWWTCTTDS